MSESKRKIALGISDIALEEFIKIWKILGNEASISIFLFSEKGITSSKETIKNLGLTQKKFYSRIKELIDIGLIEKREGKYKLTQLGKIFLNTIKKIEPILLVKEKLKIIDEMENSEILTEDKKNNLIKTIFPEEINNLLIDNEASLIKIIPTFEDLKKELIVEIRKCEDSILFVNKYCDLSVAGTILEKIESGVELFYIMEEYKKQDVKKILGILLSPKSINIIYDFLTRYKKNVRVLEKIMNSFIIIDNKTAFVEITNPLDGGFLFSVKIKDKKIIDILSNTFFNVWKMGKEFSIM